MARLRCPSCQLPMTDAEASSGACPSCGGTLETSAGPEVKPSLFVPREAATPGFVKALLWGIFGVGLFAFVCWMIVDNMPQAIEPKKLVAEGKKETKPKPATPTLDEKKAKESPGAVIADPEKIAEEPAKSEKPPVVKKESPKEVAKVDPKKEHEPKNKDPKQPMKEDPAVAKKEEPKAIPRPPALRVIPFLKAEVIKIDGDLNDWKDVAPVALFAVRQGRGARPVFAPEMQTAYFAHTPKGILIAVEATDTSGLLENAARPTKGPWEFSNNDALEVFVDTRNSRDRRRGGEHTHHFFAFPFGANGETNVAGYEAKLGKAEGEVSVSPLIPPHQIVRAAKKTLVGWSMEMLIPRTALRQDIKPGEIIALELQLDTGTNVVYFSSSKDPSVQVSLTPSAWDEAMLAGSDATLEILNNNKQPTSKAPLGQPFFVRITDHDRDLNPALKEKIEVTLRTSSGTVRKLMLEETGVRTGIFMAGIIPKLKAPANDPALLNVESDDAIAVEYVEPARANGDRDVGLRASVTTGIRLK